MKTGKRTEKLKRGLTVTLAVIVCVSLLAALCVPILSIYVKASTQDKIISAKDAAQLADVDCVLVLGCLVRADGTPSDMLSDRLTRGIELYQAGVAPKVLMSGDHGKADYDEVGTMKQVAVDAGIDSADVFLDHAGFSTYDSLFRAKEIFGADKIVIVTQEYHLYRALYIAEQLGIEAYGVASDYHTYVGQTARDLREILARAKDWAVTLFKPAPAYLGDPISLEGNGDTTNG